MLNNYAETGSGFNSNHGQTSRPAETQKQQNIGSSWGYNSQIDGMYYGGEHQPMFMGHYEGTAKHSNYSQYPSGTIHQPVPTPVVKCHEACCQHFPDRYPLNPAPLRYQPTGPVQPRYTDLSSNDSRQYFTDRRSMPQSLSRKKMYPAENGYPGIPERHFQQYMGRGQLHMADSRQQMQMMRSQYPMYPPYWGSARGWPGPRMNCPPPPYHQSVNQGTQLQSGLKMPDGPHYMDPPSQKSIGSQHRRGVSTGSGGSEIIRPVPETKRSALDPNIPSCYEFGYPTGFVPFSEVNKIQGGSISSQGSNSACKIPSDKQYHPHQMQYSIPGNDRNMMNCTNTISDLGYPMNFPMSTNESYMRSGLDEGQTISDGRKLSLQYDSSLGKKRPELDLRQYLATWEDDEDENTRITEPLAIGNNGAPYIVVDCRSLEGETAGKNPERFKTSSSQPCTSKSRNSSPNSECKSLDEQSRPDENTNRGLPPDFQSQSGCAPSMPTLMSDSDKSIWNGINRDNDGVIGKGGAFQPLDCSKRDGNIDPNSLTKRDNLPHNELPGQKISGANESANMSLDALVSYYGDNRRSDGGYDFVEMTERLVNNTEKALGNRAVLDHQAPTEITRPCDPRLQQSQFGNNPSIYNKMAPRYPSNNYQHFKPMSTDPYYNYKHPIGPNKYFGFDNSQIIDQNYEYHKLTSDFDNARLYSNKDISKDPRRLFHQEVDKVLDSSFLEPLRKGQIADCFPDKSNLEFNGVDPDQFISPIVVKKSDLDIRDKHYTEKNSAIRKRMNAINGENQPHSEKTVLITSENGPSEIFRVPYSPDKEIMRKDNVVTLHSGDQSKSNTITVEVPYVQQYSTLVKLSEEISRSENSSEKCSNPTIDTLSSDKSSNEDFKKPTSFKLKRLPNSKEWTVEGTAFNERNKKDVPDGNSTNVVTTDCETSEGNDSLKPVTVSNLNMPSLDDIRDGDENCDSIGENQTSSKLIDMTSKNAPCINDESVKSKHSSQTPQMAIVQPMKLKSPDNERLEPNIVNKSVDEEKCQPPLTAIDHLKTNDNNFDSDKILSEDNTHLNLVPENDSSKHETFRTHKKIQSTFSSTLQSCLSSPGDDFLHSQDLNAGSSKEPYSPFHVYSDCDMNSQITDYFKIDEASAAGEKLLDARMPSSPGVEGMFEDINSTSQNHLYQAKACNFQDLTDPNITSVTSHNPHFQSFSSIFSDEADKQDRSDGSILQMSDKKYIKQIFGDIDHDQHMKSVEEERMEVESDSLIESTPEKSASKRSPPIPTISLKLNESKKIWCIAKKEQCSEQNNSPKSTIISDSAVTSTSPSVDVLKFGTENELSAESIKNKVQGGKHTDIKYNSCKSPNNKCSQNDDVCTNTTICEEDSSCILLSNKCITNVTHTEQKCLSVVKYHPKIKLFRRIISCQTSTISKIETLTFDTYGTHFPKNTQAQESESKSIAKYIIDELIINSVTNISELENIDSINLEITQSNISKSTNNNLPNVKSVIILDQSITKNNDIHSNDLISTTKTFILCEKEASKQQHRSVIKSAVQEEYVTPSYCNKTIRSIFSPMSEDIVEDEVFNFDSSLQQADINDLAGKSNFVNVSNKSSDLNTIQPTKYNKIPQNDVIEEKSNVSNIHSAQELDILNTVDDNNEEFRGFSSPKPESPNRVIPCSFQNLQTDFNDIDAAEEVMDLTDCSECKNEDITVVTIIQKKDKSFNLEDRFNTYIEHQKNVSDTVENAVSEIISHEESSDSILLLSPLNDLEYREECKNNRKVIVADEKILTDITLDVNDHSCNSAPEATNSCHSKNHVDESQECTLYENEQWQKPNDKNLLNSDDLIFSSLETCSDKIMDSTEKTSENKNDLETCDIKECHSTKSPQTLEKIYNEECVKPKGINETFNTKPLQIVSSNNFESCIVPNNISKPSGNPIDKECNEDFEARLETSVIVRNNNFNCNPMSGDSIEKDLCLLSGTKLLANNLDESVHILSANTDAESYLMNLKIDIQEQNSVRKLVEESGHLTNYEVEQQMCDKTVKKSSLTLDGNYTDNPNLLSNKDSQFNEHTIEVGCYVSQMSDIKVISKSDCSDVPVKLCPNTSISDDVLEYFYCVGESPFLQDEELSKCLKDSNCSYFYNFKEMKWRKFCKLHNSNKNTLMAESVNFNNTLYHKHNSQNHEEKENVSVFADKSETTMLDSDKDEDLKCREKDIYLSNDVTYLNTDCQQQNELDSSYEHVKEKENSNDIMVKNQSRLLKDKLQFLMSKEIKGCLIRRDSLKTLEPEAVLKEIFSPDPEIENSETKENECPGYYSLDNNDLTQQFDSAKTVSSNNITEKTKLNNLQLLGNENNDSSNNNGIARDNDKIFQESKDNRNIVTEIKDLFYDGKSVKTPDLPLTSNNDSCDMDVLENLQNSQPVLSLQELDVTANTIHDISQDTVTDLTGQTNSTEALKCDDRTSVLLNSKSTNKLIKKQSHEVKPEDVTSSDINYGGSFNPLENKINTSNENNSSLLNEEIEDPQRINQCSNILSDEETRNEQLTSKDTLKENSECIPRNIHPNKDNDLNKESVNTETPERVETEKILTTIPDNNSDLSENDHAIGFNKNKSSEEGAEVEHHSEQSKTVQDSLAANQSLNEETFPLQCLVEAALALENGECKQTLLNKTNFNVLYSLDNTIKPDHKENMLDVGVENNSSITIKDKGSTENMLSADDEGIFSKFEENNYNLRPSTRIVTSSSSNIIPYSKRKYGIKSSKLKSDELENKVKKSASAVSEKTRAKKRRGVFTYPRSKRRRKCPKDKQTSGPTELLQTDSEENLNDSVEFDVFQPDFGKVTELTGNNDEILESNDIHFEKSLEINSNIETIDGVSKHDFGGPLLIANENSSTEGNIFCVRVNSDKMDEYVNHLNLGEIEVLSDNNSTVFKEPSTASTDSEVPNVTLENGTSLVIIIEDLDSNLNQGNYNKSLKGDSDIILGSIEEDRSPCLTQSNSILDECSNMLTSDFSVNDSCICPPEFGINDCDNNLLKEKNDQILEGDSFLSKTAYEINDNIEDIYGKYSVNCSQELLTTNCYEEINENLVNDIGNWPFVEEEVAEFDNKPDLPNKIPEVGRKIELKCSLPWKKIFNISKNKKKKSKTARKMSGLELGPANVEVRLKAPSAEWKVISDYHDNSSPVVKVSRLILQRDSDNSSYSEKDSEEENENRRKLSESSLNPHLMDDCNHTDVKAITNNENWQPVVILTRNKELDELTLSMETKLQEKAVPPCSPTIHAEQDSTTEANSIHSSVIESDESENDNVELNDSNNFSDSSESLCSSKSPESKSMASSPKDEDKMYASEKSEKVVYELYSPSGCNNSCSNLNIYSPSDPHFSPNNEYVESDNEILQNESASSSERNLNSNDEPYVMADFQNTDNESDNHKIDMKNSPKNIDECSLYVESNKDCFNDSISSSNESKGENENSSHSLTSNEQGYCSDKSTKENSDTMDDRKNLLKGISMERKTKPKRKMPKNFFVRKKLKRLKENCQMNDERLIFGEESDTTKSLDSVDTSNLNSLKCCERDDDKDSSYLIGSSHNESQSTLSSSLTENLNNSESDYSGHFENSRLHSVSETEDASPARLNEYYTAERIEVNQRVRDAGRGIKRPCEGHSKQDTKRRRKKLRNRSSRCEECKLQFQNKEELSRHTTYRHTGHRELHHCMLCQRSFSSATRHSLHTQGRSHRHLELSQRHVIHAVHRLLVGGPYPRLPPLSTSEEQALQWRPSQPGYTHVYHGLSPLQLALQEHNSSTFGAATSEETTKND